MKNYLVIDGKRIDLTEEQVKILTEEKREDIIHRSSGYFFIDDDFRVVPWADGLYPIDEERFEKGNYYPEQGEYEKTREYYDLAAQDALHDELRSRLRMFTRNYGWNEGLWEDEDIKKWYISDDKNTHNYVTRYTWFNKRNDVYFISEKVTEQAIKRVVKPFVKEHPDFVW